MARPSGPFPAVELDFWVVDGTPGVFLLSKDGKNPDYLGASEKDMKPEILRATKQEQEAWFLYYYAKSPASLYEVTCEWYHEYSPRNLPTHPEPPAILVADLSCPVLGCQYHR
jgi:hypothetical protein